MKYQTEIITPIILAKNVENIEFKNTVAVSLDCCQCERSGRTIVLHKNEEKSFCTPTKHHFNGCIKKIVISDRLKSGFLSSKSVVTATYLVEHAFKLFSDKKYPHRKISPDASWARVSFKLRCSCGIESEHSTQNNIVRPWIAKCGCGKDLYYENNEAPIFKNKSRA